MPKHLILFSLPTPTVFKKLKTELFPDFLVNKKLAYMPSDGQDRPVNAKYTPVWQEFIKNQGAEFVYIDNSKRGEAAKKEADRILSCNLLLITGGNTFTLLNHLRESGLDKTVIKFWNQDDVVLSGFSAGALVLTPSIRIAKTGDPNEVGLTDLTGLNIIDFEVWPHYSPDLEPQLTEFLQKDADRVLRIGNEDLVTINYKQ